MLFCQTISRTTNIYYLQKFEDCKSRLEWCIVSGCENDNIDDLEEVLKLAKDSGMSLYLNKL